MHFFEILRGGKMRIFKVNTPLPPSLDVYDPWGHSNEKKAHLLGILGDKTIVMLYIPNDDLIQVLKVYRSANERMCLYIFKYWYNSLSISNVLLP